MYRDAILIHAIKLCGPGEAIPKDIIESLVPRGDPRHEWSTIFHTQRTEEFIRRHGGLAEDGKEYAFSEYKDPIALRFSSPEDVEGRLRGINNSITSARRQLPAGQKGVIYIDAAIDDFEPQEMVYRRLSELIDGWIANSGLRVKGLMIVNAYPTSSATNVRGWCVRTMGRIRPPESGGLSDDFPLLGELGVHDRQGFFSGEWGDF